MRASEISTISIDHTTPMYDVMHQQLDKLIEIQRICDHLKAMVKGPTFNVNLMKKVQNQLHNNKIIKTIQVNQLLDELKLLASHMDLQLMNLVQNIKKGKNSPNIINKP